MKSIRAVSQALRTRSTAALQIPRILNSRVPHHIHLSARAMSDSTDPTRQTTPQNSQGQESSESNNTPDTNPENKKSVRSQRHETIMRYIQISYIVGAGFELSFECYADLILLLGVVSDGFTCFIHVSCKAFDLWTCLSHVEKADNWCMRCSWYQPT